MDSATYNHAVDKLKGLMNGTHDVHGPHTFEDEDIQLMVDTVLKACRIEVDSVTFTVPIKCPECEAVQEGSEFLGVASHIQITCQACDHVALLGEFRKETPGYGGSKRKGDGEAGD